MAQLPSSFDASQYPVDEPATQQSAAQESEIPPGFENLFAELMDPASQPADPWNNPVPQPAPTRSRHVTCHIREDKRLVIDHIPDGYTEEEREIIEHWYPELYMQPSEHARNSHGVVLTGEDVLLHARAMFKEQEKAQAAKRKATKEAHKEHQAEFANSHMEWIAACGHRKQTISAAKAEVNKRKLERKTALAKFNADWEAYENQALLMLQEAEQIPVPPRPEKPGN